MLERKGIVRLCRHFFSSASMAVHPLKRNPAPPDPGEVSLEIDGTLRFIVMCTFLLGNFLIIVRSVILPRRPCSARALMVSDALAFTSAFLSLLIIDHHRSGKKKMGNIASVVAKICRYSAFVSMIAVVVLLLFVSVSFGFSL